MLTSEVISRFLAWCEPRRRPATVKHYRSRLRALGVRLGEREFAALKPLDIQECLDTSNAGKAPDTQRANIVAFERLQGWALEMDIIKEPITKKTMEKPRGRRRERIPTAEETRALLTNSPQAFRLMYTALRQSGARPGELCRARVSDIDRKLGAIVLKDHKTAAKTGKPRVIVIGKALEVTISESLGDRTAGPLFLTSTGKPWTTTSFSAAFRRIRDKLKLAKDLVPYLARHEFATRVVRTKGIAAAGQALGHADIKTTQRYTHLNLEDVRRAQDSAFQDDDSSPPTEAA